ncbi:MAG: GNAT family N-acetyltransferase [bacterium]
MEIITVEKGDATEVDYQAVIDNSPDSAVFHTLEWRNVIEDTLGDESRYFVCYDGGAPVGVLPSFSRETELGSVLNSLAFSGSYGGVCIRSGAERPGEIADALLSHALDFARDSGCLTATFIASPLSNRLRDIYIDSLKPDFIYDRITQFTNLTEPHSFKPSVRNHISKAHKLGVSLNSELTPEHLDWFYNAYLANMSHLGLAPKPRSFFDSVAKRMVPAGRAKFYFSFAGDVLVSGLLMFFFRDGAMNHETCFDRAFKEYQGNSFLLDAALRESRNTGYSYFNWGASENRECGVYRFKAAWGAREYNYSYYTRMLRDCSHLRAAGPKKILETFGRFYYVIPFSWL